ncbi:MAG: hypothetical protein QXR81_06755 [Candidatus Nezhaarchaeales archaeon]
MIRVDAENEKRNESVVENCLVKEVDPSFTDVVVRFCAYHSRWEWYDPGNGWSGSFPATLSADEVEKRLNERYRCPNCGGIHCVFEFL